VHLVRGGFGALADAEQLAAAHDQVRRFDQQLEERCPLRHWPIVDPHPGQQPGRARVDRLEHECPAPPVEVIAWWRAGVHHLTARDDLPQHQGVRRVRHRDGHRQAGCKRHLVVGHQRRHVRVEPVDVAGAQASLEEVVAVHAGAARIPHLGQPRPDLLGWGTDSDRVGPSLLGGREEVVARQGLGDLLVGGAPVLLAAGHRQHPKVAASKRQGRLANMPGPHRHAPPSAIGELPASSTTSIRESAGHRQDEPSCFPARS
jgi:hypothetical protein